MPVMTDSAKDKAFGEWWDDFAERFECPLEKRDKWRIWFWFAFLAGWKAGGGPDNPVEMTHETVRP